jgi:hypothetical protein
MGLSRKSIFLNLFWSSASFLTGIVRTIFLIPIFLSNWDNKLYGYWLLIFSFYSISIYVIEGYSRYTINEYSKLFFREEKSAYEYFGSGLRFLIVLVSVCFALLLIVLNFSTPVEKLFHVGADTISYYKLQYCLLLVFGLAGIHSICKFLGYAISPHGKIYVPERFIALYVLAESVLWVIAALGYLSIFNFFILYFIVLSIVSVLFVVIIARNNSFFRNIFSGGSFKAGLGGSSRSISFIINNFCEKFTVEGLVFIVSSLFSAVMVPVYSATRTLANFMVTGTNMIVATFTIEYQKHNVNKDGRSLFNLFNATWLLVGFIVNYGVVVFYPFLPSIFRFWTKNQLEFNQLFFNYVLAASIFIVYGSNIITYLKSVNRIKEVFIVAVARAAILLILIILFPKKLVFIGLGLLITEFFINCILLNLFLYYELGKMQTGAILGKILWNILPFGITAVYILTNGFISLEPYFKMTITLVIITIGYFIQIMKVDNEVLVVRLQIIKHKLLGGKRSK